MNADVLYELIKTCLAEGFIIVAPIAITALVIGVVVSVLQTVTSIQEQTLTFVPKLVGSAFCIWLLAPWILNRLGNLTTLFMQRAGDILR